MKKVLAVTAVLALLCLGSLAQADVFNLGGSLTNLETVRVGDPGNAADTRVMTYDGTTGYGSVGYTYNIGKYEVTAGQYTEFLNAKAKSDPYGLYNTFMGNPSPGNNGYACNIQRSGLSGSYTYSVASDYANRPVNNVSYYDSLRFANWLSNGQGNGDTETGAYAIQSNTYTRTPGWTGWAVASENEWYKAAYYKGGGLNAGYWDYASGSDSMDTDMANYGWSVGHTTAVGSYGYTSAYGTYDQNGNVWERNEAIEYRYNTRIGLRGGSFGYAFTLTLPPRNYDYICSLPNEYSDIGFRVVSLEPVPEPSSFIALGALLTPLLAFRQRRGK